MPTLLERMTARRDEILGRVEELRSAAEPEQGEGRDLTDQEWDELRRLRGDLDQVNERVAELAEIEARRQAAVDGDPTPPSRREERPEPITSGGRAEPVYRPDGEHQFFSDAYRSLRGDTRASDRITQNRRQMEAELRDVAIADFGGLVVPQFLVTEFASILRAGRAFANLIRREPLPRTDSLVIPRAQTGVTVAPQATENTAVSETDLDYDNDLTVPVRTFAGQQDVSRQTLDLGTAGIDRIIFADLVSAYAQRLDSSIIVDDGTLGTHTGVNNAVGTNAVTFTSASPTAAEFWAALAEAVNGVGSNRLAPANAIVMHPRRWAWLIGQVDEQGRPVVIHGNQSDAVNAMGAAAADFAEGQLVGTLQGLPVLVDGNIPTGEGAGDNEDIVLVLRRQDPILWELGDGSPRELRFEDVGSASLTVKLLVFSYSAFTAERRPQGVSVISGTGLVDPFA